jgi:hypothetical protein
MINVGLRFVGGINIIPELVFLFFHGCGLAYLQVVFLSLQQGAGIHGHCKLCCLFDSAYFSDVHLLFYISPMLSSL